MKTFYLLTTAVAALRELKQVSLDQFSENTFMNYINHDDTDKHYMFTYE